MLNNYLRSIRLDVGMSVSELARRAKVSRQTIHAIEKGDRKDVSGTLMLAIAKALRRDVNEIFFIDDVQHVKQKKKEVS